MKIKNLLLAFLALPLLFVACDDSVDEVEKVKAPTIELTAGEATESTLSFTITTTEATDVTWLAIEASEATPTASEVLANGTKVEANKAVTCTATELKDNTEYTIVAAVKNSSAVDKKEIKMTTLQKSDTPEDPKTTEFTATHIYTEFDNSEGYNGYGIMLGDKDFGNSGWGVDGGTYYTFYIIAGSTAGGKLPNGAYTLSSSYEANTIVEDYSYRHQMENGTLKNGMEIFSSAELVISDGKIEAQVVLNRDNSVHHIVFEGDLSVDDGSGNQGGDPDVTLTADKWLWGGSSNYGNKYQVVGEGFSVDVHFPAQFAQEYSLTAGDYIWSSTTMFGYNDFENEFTTRSFTVDGTSVAVDAGSAKVAVEGEEYAIQLVLDGRDGVKYAIEYNGKLNEKEDVGGSDIVITSLAEGEFNSTYGWYTFKGSNDTVTFDLIVNDYQSTATTINPGNFSYAPMKSFSGSEGYFFVDNFKMDGIKYKPQINSTMVVTNDGANVGITLNLFMDSGDELVVVYNGPIGEGGNTPAEPNKLETPSVAGLVSGNAVTISWQTVAGAKDYSVSLNGTFLQTVETTYIVLSDLEYSTTYSVSVVANPADTAVNTASDAGTASFTTEADPNGGGDEPENPGDGEEEWVGREVKLMLLAYQENTLYVRVNNESIYIMTVFRNGITAGKYNLAGDNKSEDILITGHATSQYGLFGGTTSFTDGDTLEVVGGGSYYTITYRVDINGDKITATYTGFLE